MPQFSPKFIHQSRNTWQIALEFIVQMMGMTKEKIKNNWVEYQNQVIYNDHARPNHRVLYKFLEKWFPYLLNELWPLQSWKLNGIRQDFNDILSICLDIFRWVEVAAVTMFYWWTGSTLYD